MTLAKQRLPWFRCNPEKLLGAIVGMPLDDGHLYLIIILRIYEVSGPIKHDVEALSLRTHIPLQRVEKALGALVRREKISIENGYISNAEALAELADRASSQESVKERAKMGGLAKAEKAKQKQLGTPALGRDQAVPNPAHLDSDKDSERKERKKGDAPRKRVAEPKVGTRISPEWQPSLAEREYAIKKGLTAREVEIEIEKFRNYWLAKAGRDSTKLRWDLTWQNWCISAMSRTGRGSAVGFAVAAEPDPTMFDRKTWTSIANIFRSTNNWKKQWGPPPGAADCTMPAELQSQFHPVM